jgi:AraC family transcriptional regulator of adaptative response / DNA-3-methyladenine glycosylase II
MPFFRAPDQFSCLEQFIQEMEIAPKESGRQHQPVCYSVAMKMTESKMYGRFLAGDPAFDGRFFTGVRTTGIYCLPSCKARKPKFKNVRFFPTCEAARVEGFRPCRKCHPDDFARGADPVLESVEALVDEIRAAPGNFPDVRAVVHRSGYGTTRVFELFRQHYHATPADLLLRTRIDYAKKRLVGTDDRLIAIAGDAGFESLSVLHVHFRRLTGLTPAAYRAIRDQREFVLTLPEEYPLAYLRRALSRDPHGISERLSGDKYEAAVRIAGAPALLTLKLSNRQIAVRIDTSQSPAESAAIAAHGIAAGILGLDQDTGAFVRLAGRLGLSRLVAGRSGLRISQTHSVFDGLLWAIIGQQINFPFACLLKRRLVERTGHALGLSRTGPAGDLFAPPEPGDVAELSPEDLLPFQFSRQKAGYLVGASRMVASGALDLQKLRFQSATRVERTLLEVRGLGPWSVNYLMMRSLGFADCVPLGDTGVTSGLLALLRLEERPDIDAIRRLMAVFSPYRSLATAHLWQFEKPPP